MTINGTILAIRLRAMALGAMLCLAFSPVAADVAEDLRSVLKDRCTKADPVRFELAGDWVVAFRPRVFVSPATARVLQSAHGLTSPDRDFLARAATGAGNRTMRMAAMLLLATTNEPSDRPRVLPESFPPLDVKGAKFRNLMMTPLPDGLAFDCPKDHSARDEIKMAMYLTFRQGDDPKHVSLRRAAEAEFLHHYLLALLMSSETESDTRFALRYFTALCVHHRTGLPSESATQIETFRLLKVFDRWDRALRSPRSEAVPLDIKDALAQALANTGVSFFDDFVARLGSRKSEALTRTLNG